MKDLIEPAMILIGMIFCTVILPLASIAGFILLIVWGIKAICF